MIWFLVVLIKKRVLVCTILWRPYFAFQFLHHSYSTFSNFHHNEPIRTYPIDISQQFAANSKYPGRRWNHGEVLHKKEPGYRRNCDAKRLVSSVTATEDNRANISSVCRSQLFREYWVTGNGYFVTVIGQHHIVCCTFWSMQYCVQFVRVMDQLSSFVSNGKIIINR